MQNEKQEIDENKRFVKLFCINKDFLVLYSNKGVLFHIRDRKIDYGCFHAERGNFALEWKTVSEFVNHILLKTQAMFCYY